MDRRNFFSRLTIATAGTAGLGSAAAYRETRTVHYQVKGFTCITCAVGLETMLRGLRGVTSAKAAYPQNTVIVGFDEHAIDESEIKEFISRCAFSVA